ncbi:MAG: ParB/RepB/Spo0J family partition protein [Rubrivivax sp.]|nr:ParB/RepB/Spo0J family partition protein [Rubrivivax sp.]
MSATTIHSTDTTTAVSKDARFLAPGTHQRADAKGKGKGQGAFLGKGTTKTPKGRTTEQAAGVEDEAFAAGDLVLIPLSRLVPSAFNVRKSGGEDVGELAALIKAQGLLQNLIVHPDETKRGKSTGDYGVAAGGRRLRALGLLAKAGDIPLDKDILCRLITRDAAIAASMAENSGRAAMSVADTVTAFAEMIAAGAGVEDVAVCFGITPLTVQRRLKLAKVSPVLFELFRQDKINLDQLMALAITDDHAAQERVWNSTPSYNRNPSGLRHLLLGREIDAATDPLAKFVGIPAYEAAGGVVVRDLFEDAGSGYITDAELLQRLAVERLTERAQAFKGEGWAWTEARTSFDHSERQGFGVATMKQRAPTPEQQAARDALLTAKEEANKGLEDLYDAEDSDDDPGFDSAKASALEAEVEAIDAKLEKLRHDLSEWTADILAFAGVVVALDRNGEVIVHRGMVKPEDHKQAAKAAAAAAGAPGVNGDAGEGTEPQGSANPESLVRKLTSHKTKALQVLMSDNTHVALAALAHTLVQQLVTGYAGGMHRTVSALNLRANDCDSALKGVADDIEASRAWGELASRLDNWRERLPGDADRLLPWLIGQPLDTLLELLALCSALSVSAMSGREADTTGDALAAAVGLDMADWWSPTAGSYLAQVPKARIVEAVTEAVSVEKAAPLAKLKKGEAVAAAEALLQGTRWLPSPLRARGPATA